MNLFVLSKKESIKDLGGDLFYEMKEINTHSTWRNSFPLVLR